MKKICFIIIMVVFSLFMTSCTETYTKEGELKKFFSSHSFDLTYSIKVPNQKAIIFKFVQTEDAFLMEYVADFGSEDLSIIIDKDNNLFYDLGKNIALVESEQEEIDEEIDAFDYIYNIQESENMLTFDFDMVEYIESMDMDLSGMILYADDVSFTCYFSDQKISRFDYEVNGVKSIIRVMNYVYGKNNSSIDAGIEIEMPELESCVKMSEEELSDHILTGASGDIDNYRLTVENYNVALTNGEILKTSFKGYIYDDTNGVKVKTLEIDDVVIDESNYTENGNYLIQVYKDYCGKRLTADIVLQVKNDMVVESIAKLDMIEKLNYMFKLDEYIYLCDDKYLYKFDIECKELLGKLDLKCIGNSHYVKDDYLYVAAHYPYDTTYNDSDSYLGTVTKIKLSEFKVEKQVHVNCLPKSIIVDKRDNVILSKGANQHVDIDQVDMETGKLTHIFSGYQNDVLLYDEVDDAITVLTYGHSGGNDLFKYNGSKWEEVGYSSIQNVLVYLKLGDSYVTDEGLYKYDMLKNEYYLEKFDYGKDVDSDLTLEVTGVFVDDGKAYILERYLFQYDPLNLIVYDIETKVYFRYMVSEQYQKDFTYMYADSGYVFIVFDDLEIIKVKI